MRKLKMQTTNSITFEEGCNKYLDNCRQRNLREGKADPMTEAFLQMAGVFSQLELAMIRARVRSGMANAKAKGKIIGRPQVTAQDIPQNFMRHYPAYKAKQLNISEFARVCDMSRTTIYKYLSLLKN